MDESATRELFRQLGSMEARIDNLEADMTEVKAGVAALLERSAAAKGGNGMLWKVGTVSTAGGGLLMAIAQWWNGRGT